MYVLQVQKLDKVVPIKPFSLFFDLALLLLFFGCAVWLVGSWFPDQGMNSGPWQ